MTRQVLVVDDDISVREALAQTLELADFEPRACGSFIEAKDHISPKFQGVILSDIRMPGRDGFYLLDYARACDPDLPVILLTGEGDIPMAVRAMQDGAFGFLEKPCDSAQLLPTIERALANRATILENRRLRKQLETGDPAARLLFGVSERADELRNLVRSVAPLGAEVLISGPPGSGISKVAEVIHLMSPLANGPFVKCASAGLSVENLREQFRRARGGSIFFDEIAALPEATQHTALEMIEQGQEARFMAGTTADLADLAGRGDFYPDLFYRLDVIRVRIPALSERPEDIPVIFAHYVAQAAEQSGLPRPEIPAEYLSRLMAQDWPGNARSLMSAAMRYVLGVHEDVVGAVELGLNEQMARVERSLLIAALARQNGVATEAAKLLKLPRKTFYDKLNRHGIQPEDYRRS